MSALTLPTDCKSFLYVLVGAWARAALAAVDAPASSCLLDAGPSVEAGLTVEDAGDVLVAVAPIVGAPRSASAAAKIMEALDLVIELAQGRRRVGTGRLSVALGPGTGR